MKQFCIGVKQRHAIFWEFQSHLHQSGGFVDSLRKELIKYLLGVSIIVNENMTYTTWRNLNTYLRQPTCVDLVPVSYS